MKTMTEAITLRTNNNIYIILFLKVTTKLLRLRREEPFEEHPFSCYWGRERVPGGSLSSSCWPPRAGAKFRNCPCCRWSMMCFCTAMGPPGRSFEWFDHHRRWSPSRLLSVHQTVSTQNPIRQSCRGCSTSPALDTPCNQPAAARIFTCHTCELQL